MKILPTQFPGEPVPASPENARSFIRVSRMPHINSRLLNGAGYKNSIKIAHQPGLLPRHGPGTPSASTASRVLKIDPKAAAAHRAWSDLCGSWASGEQTAQPRRALPDEHWVCQKSGRNPTLGSSPCACRCLSIQFHRVASSDRRQRNPGPAVALRKNAVSFRIAFVPRLISLALRVATKYDDIAVGCGCDRSRGFRAFSAIFRSLARAFCSASG